MVGVDAEGNKLWSAREVIRSAPFGRIAFSNTDLSGSPDHRTAIAESDWAVGQLLDRVLT